MAFNHYARLQRILAGLQDGWYIRRINTPTTAVTFGGETRQFDHYYRLFTADGTQVKYGKFQQLDRLAQVLKMSPDDLPVVEGEDTVLS